MRPWQTNGKTVAAVALRAAVALTAAALVARGAEARTTETNQVRVPDYATFRVVVERNIFNASRSGRASSRERDTRRPSRVESFGLVGTMSYEKGPLAFFDGTATEYRKALKPGDAIAGHRVEAVRPSAVTLNHGTNSFELRVGAQMRREDDGEWKASGQFDVAAFSNGGGSSRGPSGGSASASGGSSSGSSSGGGGDMSEVLKRLMEKREKESQ